MTLKSIIQDVRDGIGSISRRSSFDLKLPYHHHHHHHHHQQQQQHHRSRSLSAVLDESQFRHALSQSQSCWAHMPPELLWDIVQRLESSESSWPGRRDVVACAGVCRSWRQIAKEIVKTVEQSGKLTFPISLKQPGPRDFAVQCFIKRDRTASTYRLYLGLSPTLGDPGKFLLAARKVRRPTSTDYIISLDTDDMSRGSNTYVGKLRSNFLGTKFTIYDSQPPHSGAIASTSRAGRRIGSKQVSPRVPAGSFSVAHIAYELNVLGTRGPRKMQCIAYSIPASALDPGGVAPTPSEFTTSLDCSLASLPSFGSKSTFSELGLGDMEDGMGGSSSLFKDGPLVLKNKAPRWHEQLQCWCLNFRGRVTVASVKNFQLVATSTAASSAPDSVAAPTSSQNDHDKVILQFGKVGKDMFTMDYRYPLSAFQAFAICLSSFDTKLACE